MDYLKIFNESHNKEPLKKTLKKQAASKKKRDTEDAKSFNDYGINLPLSEVQRLIGLMKKDVWEDKKYGELDNISVDITDVDGECGYDDKWDIWANVDVTVGPITFKNISVSTKAQGGSEELSHYGATWGYSGGDPECGTSAVWCSSENWDGIIDELEFLTSKQEELFNKLSEAFGDLEGDVIEKIEEDITWDFEDEIDW